MVFDPLSFLALALLAVLFAWITWRAAHVRLGFLRWLAVLVANPATLLLLSATVFAAIGYYRLSASRDNPVPDINVQDTPEQLARGERLANYCAVCHSSAGTLPLNGSTQDFAEAPGVPSLGDLYPPNLTPAGPLSSWSDGQIIRAIREGIHANGRTLVLMPSGTFHNMSDEDVQAVVGYLRSQPAVQHNPPSNQLNVLGVIMVGLGFFPTSAQPPVTQPIVAPPEGTPAYGEYLVAISGCRGCHGPDLAGRKPFGFAPSGPNLTAAVPKWSLTGFTQTFRVGVDPEGDRLDPQQMPWRNYSPMFSDDDLAAIYAYLHSLKPQASE
jgi:mono/diheme cytochrome c family protein